MKKPHYYYKAAEGSSVSNRLHEFFKECQEAEEAALDWVKRQGAEFYFESPEGMSGGVAAVEFEKTIAKEGWEVIKTLDGNRLFVPEEGSDLDKEMRALPVVSESKLIAILGFKPHVAKNGATLPFSFGTRTPIVFFHHGCWYADVPYECEAPGIENITDKEFFRRKMAATNESRNRL